MDVEKYLLDIESFDTDEALTEWRSLLPESFDIWLINLFGDMFLIVEDGSVHRMDVGGATVTRIADNEEHFCQLIDRGDNAANWLLYRLVDKLRERGEVLTPGTCYSWLRPPCLGGALSSRNAEVADIYTHYSIHGQIASQVKNLKPGARIKFAIDDAD